MTRKDYVLIATALCIAKPQTQHFNEHTSTCVTWAWEKACIKMAEHLANDNPRFDRARFLIACGVSQ